MATGIAVQILDAQSQQEIPLNQVQPLTPLKAGITHSNINFVISPQRRGYGR